MLDGLKKAFWYTVILALFLTVYQLYLQPFWNAWVTSTGHTVGLLETWGGYCLAIVTGLLARFMIWRVKGK
jgi:hypothetical protein